MQSASPATAQTRPDHIEIDPVARVNGPLALDVFTDGNGARPSVAARANLFRGYERVLMGRDIRDGVFISSRSCGACGGAHASCAALALEMALGVQPPPMGIAARNLLSTLECLSDVTLGLFTRIGPDFSEATVRASAPPLWQRAEQTGTRRQAVHGFGNVSEVLSGLSRLHGALYVEALQMSRLAAEAYAIIGGKLPHPQTIVPGGVSSTVDTSELNEILLRIVKMLDFAQKTVAIWDELVEFLIEADGRHAELGASGLNFIDLGIWDDPAAYDATFENCADWGARRWCTPGAIVDGKLVATSLPEIDQGAEEVVEHSFYEQWEPAVAGGDPGGRQLPPGHPSMKQTLPAPGSPDLNGKYSWCTAPRWNRSPMETGAGARLWITATSNVMPHRRFIEPTGSSIRLTMPQGALPAAVLEWSVPQRWGTLERIRARAYFLAFSGLVAYEHALAVLDLKRTGQDRISTPFPVRRDECAGIGFWGSPRGYLSHHLAADRGVIENYQLIGPSTWTVSPKDAAGVPGPCEQAVAADARSQPLVDLLRTVRSFDPCVTCATH